MGRLPEEELSRFQKGYVQSTQALIPAHSRRSAYTEFLIGVCWACLYGQKGRESPHLGIMTASDGDLCYKTL